MPLESDMRQLAICGPTARFCPEERKVAGQEGVPAAANRSVSVVGSAPCAKL
jgi:hypothetical protein